MAVETGAGLLALGVGLGLRHGIDYDHIAAITDITGASPSRLRGFLLGTIYAVGHALVVLGLGLLALGLGAVLPEWVDPYLERVVGVTLVVLGVWVFWSLLRNPREFRLRARWLLLFAGVRFLYRWLLARITGRRPVGGGQEGASYGVLGAGVVGVIHGLGAETGSQALLLASVAGVTTFGAGSLLLSAFVLGLLLSNTALVVASALGFFGAGARRTAYIALGVVVGVFSLVLGTLFLLGKGALLPSLLA